MVVKSLLLRAGEMERKPVPVCLGQVCGQRIGWCQTVDFTPLIAPPPRPPHEGAEKRGARRSRSHGLSMLAAFPRAWRGLSDSGSKVGCGMEAGPPSPLPPHASQPEESDLRSDAFPGGEEPLLRHLRPGSRALSP